MISMAVNGAELLRLERERVAAGARSLPQYVRHRCGLPAGLVSNGVVAQDLGVRRALERHVISFYVTEEEYAALRDQSSLPNGPGITIAQHARTRCDLPVRYVSKPGTQDRDREEDEAWAILNGLGLAADDYFEAEQ